MGPVQDLTVPFSTPASNVGVPTAKNHVPSIQQILPNPIPVLNELAQQHHLQSHKGQTVTPIQVLQLQHWLHGYDSDITKFLVEGFTYGFKIPFRGVRSFRQAKNLNSALQNPQILRQKIEIETQAGRVAGPFSSLPMPNMQISPSGLVPKKSPGEFRFIQHLSFPEGLSVNDGIPREFCSVQYQNIDHAVALIRKFGKGALMSKTDIENAFRLMPISPADYELLGFCVDNKYYYDKTLPQGLGYSCFLFENFSTSLQWIAENKLHIPGCAHVLDDFLFVGPPNYQKCLSNLNSFLDMAGVLGVPIKQEKPFYHVLQSRF